MSKAPQRKRTFWKILFYTLVSLVAIILLAIASLIFWLFTSRDLLDRFEVIAVDKANGAGPYIATYSHHYSNSSAHVWATWIVDRPPSVGSTEPPPGLADPVLVWTDPGHVISQQLGERLRVVIQNDLELHDGDLRPCYWHDSPRGERKRHVCYHSEKVELIRE